MIFSRAQEANREDQHSGYWLSNHCLHVVSIISSKLTEVVVLQKKNSFLVLEGVKLLKCSMVPVTVGFDIIHR